MKRQWTDEELEAHFTLHSTELDLVGDSKTDHNLLGFAALLKYFQHEGRFPSQKQDIPVAVTRHIAHQLGVATKELLAYDWDGRTIKHHRAAIRAFLGFRETTIQDEEVLVSWPCQEVLGEQQQEDALLVAAYQYCQKRHIDHLPPIASPAYSTPHCIALMSSSVPLFLNNSLQTSVHTSMGC